MQSDNSIATEGGPSAIFDDEGVPTVVLGRLRLIDKVAAHYGLQAVLYIDEDACPRHMYQACIRDEATTISIPLPIQSVEEFDCGLKAVYSLLQVYNKQNKSLAEMICDTEVRVSGAVSPGGPARG